MAANTWQPGAVLNIGDIPSDRAFSCVGYTKNGKKCTNPISKGDRLTAQEDWRKMSTLDVTSHDFTELLEHLANALLCKKSAHRRTQATSTVALWQKKIEEFGQTETAQRGENVVTGEPWGTRQEILDDMGELAERLHKLLQNTTPDSSRHAIAGRTSH